MDSNEQSKIGGTLGSGREYGKWKSPFAGTKQTLPFRNVGPVLLLLILKRDEKSVLFYGKYPHFKMEILKIIL